MPIFRRWKMKFVCPKTSLGNALAALSRIIPTRPAHPILNCFMMFTKDNNLVLQATDLELGLTVTIPAEMSSEGCTVVAGRHLTDLVRRLPDCDLMIQIVEETGQLEILYGKSAAHISTLAPTDYPALPAMPAQNKIIIDGNIWKSVLKKILIAAAPQEVRPNYAGVYINLQSGSLKLVATDTYRLAYLTMPYQGDTPDFSLFVPVRPLNEVSRLLEDEQQLEISWDQSLIAFHTKTFTMTARLMDAQFPAYEKVIPKQFQLRVRVNKDFLNAALERAALFNETPSGQAVVDLKIEAGTLYISAESTQVGSIKEEIPLAGVDGVECGALFTTRYLLDPLKVIDHAEVTLCLNGPSEPAVYLDEEGEAYLHLILPVRRLIET
jgi:DNA polymerase-3 subunit beta